MRVLAAPDKFAGSLTAPEAARAIATGWTRGDPKALVETVPVADGGEGTLDTLVAALGGRLETVRVSGPLGDPVDAELGVVDTPRGRMAIVEMARASGLQLVPPDRRDALRANTRGTGELLVVAARLRPRRLLVCIGGSATTDGGAGMAQALGVRLLDEEGRELGPGGGALGRLARIDAAAVPGELREIEIVVASDVDSPLVGPEGAAATFGPQKGATAEDVEVLEAGLQRLAEVIGRDVGIDVSTLPGGGAAGGLGAGLVAFLGARIDSGFDVVADALGLAARVDRADVVVTGEGSFDEQSLRGKAPGRVLALAGERGRRTVLIAGQVSTGEPPAADLVYALSDRASSPEDAMTRAAELLETAAADAARASRGTG